MKWFYQCTLCELSTKSIFKVIGHWFLHFFFHLYAHLKTKFWINITSQSSTSWGCHGYVAALKSMSHMISTTHVCLMVSNARNSQSTAHEQSKTQCCREDLSKVGILHEPYYFLMMLWERESEGEEWGNAFTMNWCIVPISVSCLQLYNLHSFYTSILFEYLTNCFNDFCYYFS